MKKTFHSLSRHPVYKVYYAIRGRCRNKTNPNYANYGGRGIKLCDRWSTFTAFWEDLGKHWKPGLTIERLDNDLGYTPENCMWVTYKENQQNKRNTKQFSYKGKKQSVKAWARHFGIPKNTAYYRITHGWSFEQTMGLAPRRGH